MKSFDGILPLLLKYLCVSVLGCVFLVASPMLGQETFRAVRLPGNPIITAENPAIPLEGKGSERFPNINGPALIRVPDWIENPLGKYYLYFAHHHGSFIRLAYADDIMGPWTVYEPGTLRLEQTYGRDAVPPRRRHIASPDIFIDEERRELRMYCHMPYKDQRSQITMVATSRDGLNFVAQPQVLGRSYFRVFRHEGAYYAVAKYGDLSGILFRSDDGLKPFEPGPKIIPNMRHAAVLKRDDRLYIFYSRSRDYPERILMSWIDLSDGPWTDWRVSEPVEILKPEMEWEGADLPKEMSSPGAVRDRVRELRDPEIFEEDGRIFMVYSIAGEWGLAIAELFPE